MIRALIIIAAIVALGAYLYAHPNRDDPRLVDQSAIPETVCSPNPSTGPIVLYGWWYGGRRIEVHCSDGSVRSMLKTDELSADWRANNQP